MDSGINRVTASMIETQPIQDPGHLEHFKVEVNRLRPFPLPATHRYRTLWVAGLGERAGADQP
jgi:hypothetical protein